MGEITSILKRSKGRAKQAKEHRIEKMRFSTRKRRTFNGVVFYLDRPYSTKREARKVAEQARDKGYNVRIVEAYSPVLGKMYEVYLRKADFVFYPEKGQPGHVKKRPTYSYFWK